MRPALISGLAERRNSVLTNCEIECNAPFWAACHKLPTDIQGLARKAYRLFASNPQHRSLRFTAVAVAAEAVLLNAADSDWG